MTAYIIRRLLILPLIMVGVSMLIFAMMQILGPVERSALYIRDFPKLQCYTRAEPLIKRILEVAAKQKRELVIATNPVFPEIAIRQRLQWAGIGHLPFRLITTYENMHFCKPHLEYYSEILKKLNRLPGDCLMIGNDAREDLAANGVGISTFLLKNHLIDDATETYAADHEGYLEDLYRLVCSS